MADAPKILGTDSLRQAYPKLNSAIDNSNEALTKAKTAESNSTTAVNTANTAVTKADSVQAQFNQVVIEGDSSVEAAQARIKADGTAFTTLRDRMNDSDAHLAQSKKQQQTTPILQPYDSRTELFREVFIHDADNNIYAVYSRTGATYDLEKSSDNGVSWVKKGTLPAAAVTIVKISKTGTLLAIEQTAYTSVSNPRVWRSTNEGATWTTVNAGLNFPVLGAQGVTETPSGAICVGEYGNVGNQVYRILRSVDDGITWSAVLSSSGTDPQGDPGHIHSVTYDPYANKLVAFMDRPYNGVDGPYIYASSDDGATWNMLGISKKNTHPNFVAPMYFETHIAWGSDNDRNGVISRIKREDFYSGAFDKVEDVAHLNKKVFYFTFPIRNGVWVVSMANETVASASVPEGAGNFANEVFIISDNGKVVSGGISHFQHNSVPGTLSARRVTFPSYKFDRLDHTGLSWMNITTGTPRAYGAMPYSQGEGLPTSRTSNWQTQLPTLPNMIPLHGKGNDGSLIPMIHVDEQNRVIIKNGLSGSAGLEVRLMADGNFWLVENGKTLLYTSGGSVISPVLKVAGNGVGFFAGSGDPNNSVTAPAGSIYMNWNGGRGVTLWLKESGSGNTGWVPSNHSSGPSTARPTNPIQGMQFYDATLGKPIWWNGSVWKDAMGTNV